MPPTRTRRPVYFDRLPPCNDACAAGENIQAWLAQAQAGHFREAWQTILRDNPLPAVHGRVCYHPCETACNRKQIDEPVAIHSVERLLGDLALDQRWPVDPPAPPSGKRVLIVGAGPSGLSAAWQLARRGHAVSIYEAGPVAGGMMHFGIPKYRLPREVLDAEIERIVSMGVDIQLNRPVVEILQDKADGCFDAVFLAVGAHLSKRQDIPADDAARIYDALQFLRQVEFGDAKPRIGRRVAVYGGGNTALDAARTARRLGAEPLIIYRRTEHEMPAHRFELDEALEEGVQVHWLRTIGAIDGSRLRVEVMQLDDNRRPVPTGRFETLEADTVIMALGQETDTTFLRNVPGVSFKADGTVIVGDDMQTGHSGIFAGGDMVPGVRSVTTAVGHGKQAACRIDAFLTAKSPPARTGRELATFDRLRLWYAATSGGRPQPRIPMNERLDSFQEVTQGLDARGAEYEARRCYSCGHCFECDGCYSACPERAVRKLGPGRGYEIDLAACTGCGICADQCPCGAITMAESQGGPGQ